MQRRLSAPGVRVRVYGEVDSTNALARQAAEAGEAEGLVLIAASQTAGRGRRGRSFFSPPGGGLYMIALLRPRLPAQDAALMTTLAAVAVAEAVEAMKEQFGHQYSQAFEVATLVRHAITYSESPNLSPVDVMERLGCDSAAQVLAGAIYTCLTNSADFDSAMIAAVNHSGRSAAVGAVTGAILGARLGEEALPDFYIECLEPAEVLRELADDLYTGCPMERGNKLFDLDWDYKYLHGGQ